jgi:hypothetical protein
MQGRCQKKDGGGKSRPTESVNSATTAAKQRYSNAK